MTAQMCGGSSHMSADNKPQTQVTTCQEAVCAADMVQNRVSYTWDISRLRSTPGGSVVYFCCHTFSGLGSICGWWSWQGG